MEAGGSGTRRFDGLSFGLRRLSQRCRAKDDENFLCWRCIEEGLVASRKKERSRRDSNS